MLSPANRQGTYDRGRPHLLAVLGFISWAALLHVACKELEDQSTQTPDRGDIGFIGASEDDPLWGVLRNTAERYPEAMAGFELRVEAPRKRSVLAQIEILRSMHTPDLRGVCIQPAVDKDTEADMLRDELVKMRASGVAVVTMLTRLDTASPFLHAGLDEMAVGAAMADAVLEAVDGDGTIAILHDRSTTDGHFDRYLGARQRCARLPALTVLKELDCANNAPAATRMLREYMERYPRLEGWIAIDNWPLRDLGHDERLLPESCRLVTYGPFPIYWPRLSDGTCCAMVGAEYDQVAAVARRMCVTAARGESASLTSYFAPPITVTAKNLDEFKETWSKWSTPATPVSSGGSPGAPLGGSRP